MAGSSRIETELVANDAQYQQAIARAVQSNLKYQRSVQNEVLDSNRKLDLSFKSLASGIKSYGGTIAGAIAGLGAASVVAVQRVADHAVELDNLSRVAAMSVEEFQAASYATEQYGITAEKLADISKDTTEKLGEFIATGGGGFKDFFEQVAPQVGLTAESLQGLSGPQVLGAVKNALDAANISAEKQTWYLESIAGDASLLSPLLADNAKKLNALTGEYNDLGLAMSGADIEMMREADRQISLISRTLSDSFAQGVVGASEQIGWLTGVVTDAAKYWGAYFDSMKDTPQLVDGVLMKLGELREEQKTLTTSVKQIRKYGEGALIEAIFGSSLPEKEAELASLNAEIDRLQTQYEILTGLREDPNAKPKPVPPTITPLEPGAIVPSQGQTTDDNEPEDPYAQLQKDLDALRLSYESKEQLLLDSTLREQEILIAAQNNRLISEQEAQALSKQSWDQYYAEVAQLTQSSADEQVDIQRGAAQSMVDTLTGDVETTDQLFQGFASGMSSAMADAALSGELSFGKMAESIISDMMRIYIQAQIVKPLMEAMGVSFGTPTVDAGTDHTGGIAGIADAGSRSVPLSTFAGAPRFHTGGIIGSEVPIIAQRGEGVFTPEQMKRLAPVGNSPAKVSIQIINNGQPAEVERTEQSQNGDMTQIKMWIRDVVNSDLNSGQGIDRTLRTQYPSLSRRGYG